MTVASPSRSDCFRVEQLFPGRFLPPTGSGRPFTAHGPCHLFRFSLDQASLRALEGNGILRSTARCARSSLRSVKRKSFWDFVLLGSDGPSFSLV